jgi:hypothetical protein
MYYRMKAKIKIAGWIIGLAALSSCASSYHAVNPQNLHYVASEETNELSFSYRYNIMQEAGNKKYAKKEDKKGIALVAVKITNHTDQSLSFQDDIELFAGSQHVYPMQPHLAHKQIKQNTPIYLLYGLLSFIQVYSVDNSGNVSSFPIGLILGPGITGLNMATAASANKALDSELKEGDLLNRTIGPGETVHGIVALRNNTGFAPLRAEVKQANLSEAEY